MKKPSFPFTILALAPFSPVPEGPVTAKTVQADISTLDDAIEELTRTISIAIPKELCPQGVLSLPLQKLKDFKPQALATNTPYLKDLVDAAKFIEDAPASQLSPQAVAEKLRAKWPELPLDLTVTADEPRSETTSNNVVDDLLSMVATPSVSSGAQPKTGGINNWRKQIDDLSAKLLEIIFADEQFRLLEATWRGVATLVRQGPVKEGEGIGLNLSHVSFDTLPGVLDGLMDQLIQDTPNLILIDLPFDNSPRSIQLLEKIADIADTLLVPIAVWITPGFFNLKSWSGLKKLPLLKHYLEEPLYAKWRTLKEQPGSNWLAVTTNRFVVRQPYGSENRPRTVFFSEQSPLWISPVWGLGTLAAKSVDFCDWPTRLTDYRHVILEDLAVGKFSGEESICTEFALTEDRIMQFIEAGIMPLMGALKSDYAFMPKETTLSGGSLRFQLFISRIIGYFFKLKDGWDEASGIENLSSALESALADFFRDTGHEPPADISIEVSQTDSAEPVPLNISFTPPWTILTTGQKIEFSLKW